jgi:hypothetical protein
MTEEQAFALVNPDRGVYVPGAFVLALGALKAEQRVADAFRDGAEMGWHEHDEDVFLGSERFSRRRLRRHCGGLVDPRPRRGPGQAHVRANAAGIGCGLGASTILLARAYPNSASTGSDYHSRSIEIARKRACDAGVADRVVFEIATADGLSRHRVRPGRDVGSQPAHCAWVTHSGVVEAIQGRWPGMGARPSPRAVCCQTAPAEVRRQRRPGPSTSREGNAR